MTFLTRYVKLIAESDASELHPFAVLGLVLHLCEGQPGDLQPAAPQGVQAGDGGNEALLFGAAADDQEYLG